MELLNQSVRERVAGFLAGDSARESVDRWLRDVVMKFTDEGHGVCFITQAPLTQPLGDPCLSALAHLMTGDVRS